MLREAPGVRLGMGVEYWYAFSFFLPADFPIVETRLVMASWKQSFNDPAKNRSLIVSLRHMGGRWLITRALWALKTMKTKYTSIREHT